MSGDYTHRQSLKAATGAIVKEAGYSYIDSNVLETLVEVLQSYLTEIGKSSRAYGELASRTLPMLSDVSVSLIDMGCDIMRLSDYAKLHNKLHFMPPAISQPVQNPRILLAGEKKEHLPHIPDYMPPYPDPHTYIHTKSSLKSSREYLQLREKAASQKHDVEKALTKYMAKVGDTENLFPDDPYAFPLIACKARSLPYLDALLPKDHDLEEEVTSQKHISTASKRDGVDTEQIDNPYLRPIRMPINVQLQ